MKVGDLVKYRGDTGDDDDIGIVVSQRSPTKFLIRWLSEGGLSYIDATAPEIHKDYFEVVSESR